MYRTYKKNKNKVTGTPKSQGYSKEMSGAGSEPATS